MQEYFANFIKTGNPNGRGLPKWPRFDRGQRLIIAVNTRAENDKVRARYEFLDQSHSEE
jgi:para-nitrobenzyl esterase